MLEPKDRGESRKAFERALVEQALASDIMGESIHMQGQVLKDLGLNHASVMTTIAAVRLGARQVLALHGASPEELKTVFKAADGATPRTEATPASPFTPSATRISAVTTRAVRVSPLIGLLLDPMIPTR